jgi:hypothetical protein
MTAESALSSTKSSAVIDRRYKASNTFMAALCPGIPLTAPPRSALEPHTKTFGHSVSTPHVPACSFLVAKGQLGAS